MDTTESIQSFTNRLELEHPGETIVLDAKTREILIVSRNPSDIAKKVQAIGKEVPTLFIGGPFENSALGFHHFCSPPKSA
jgi:hypothetical protein